MSVVSEAQSVDVRGLHISITAPFAKLMSRHHQRDSYGFEIRRIYIVPSLLNLITRNGCQLVVAIRPPARP
jgi:hypothetical protein